MDVCEYRAGVVFVHQVAVVFGLAKCVDECLEDIEARFAFVFMFSVCGLKVTFFSYVTPSVVGVLV